LFFQKKTSSVLLAVPHANPSSVLLCHPIF